MPATWQRIREVFEDLVERDADEARADLARLQAREPDVASEVASLLDHHSRAGQFLSVPAIANDPEAFDDAPVAPGEMIGAYRVEREVGRGGMGRVFLATDTRLQRAVALKLLPAAVASHPGQRERLRREARAAAALTHPGICTVYALEEIDDRLVIASEYIEGRSLRDEFAGGRATAVALEKAAIELADALASAHERGITHRDLKPENIMRAADGRLKILDFGLATVESAADGPGPRLTAEGMLLGTPAYMAPEQLKGEAADARSDVFALGVLLYEFAAGAHPFEASTPLATAARVLESQPLPMAQVRSDIPTPIAEAIGRALAKRPGDRFANAGELRAALNGGEARPVRAEVTRWWRRHQIIVIVLYLLASAAAWQVKEWVPGVARVLFPFVGVLSVVGAVFRGHLVFAEQNNHASLAAERALAKPVTAVTDVLIALALVADGLIANERHEVWALLIMGLGVGIALARVVVERATTRGAFQ
jgi:predicted Ser/Thr protein kinase